MNQTANRALTSSQEEPAPQNVPSEQHSSILAGLPPMLTLEQAAHTLQISETNARAMCREKSLPSCKVGQQWRVPRAWLEEFLEGGGSHE